MEYDVLVVKLEEAPYLVGSLERAMHSHWVPQSSLTDHDGGQSLKK
jgi:hypothetical protein